MKKIFLLEDDFSLNETIKEMLNKSGFVVDSFYSGEKAFENILGDYALYILDINVPNIDGITILEKIKSISQNSKVIIISANIDINQIILAYEKDCDDYIKKPFELKELDIRINNIKRLFNIDIKIIKIDENSYLDLQNLEINLNKKSFIISKKESEILAYLLNNPKKTISIEEIINNIWSYEDSVESSTIRTYIKNLRKILGEDKILNIRGVGYRFNF